VGSIASPPELLTVGSEWVILYPPPMSNLQTESKADLIATAERLRGIAKRARETSRTAVRRGTTVVLAGAGGFVAGAIDDRIPEVGGFPTSVVAGLALGLLGAIDGAGDQSDNVCALAGGLLAGAGYDRGRQMSQELGSRS
jgi:hypothetical protein